MPMPKVNGYGMQSSMLATLLGAACVVGTRAVRAPPAGHVVGGDDLATLQQSVLDLLIPSVTHSAMDAEVASISTTLTHNGTWPDVDYADASRSWWAAADHLRRTLLMASALRSSHSTHFNNSYVRSAAELALSWWCKTDPQNQW
jgi:hypothetical protein